MPAIRTRSSRAIKDNGPSRPAGRDVTVYVSKRWKQLAKKRPWSQMTQEDVFELLGVDQATGHRWLWEDDAQAQSGEQPHPEPTKELTPKLLNEAEELIVGIGIPECIKDWEEVARLIDLPGQGQALRHGLAKRSITKETTWRIYESRRGQTLTSPLEDWLEKADSWIMGNGIPASPEGWNDLVVKLPLPCDGDVIRRALVKRGHSEDTYPEWRTYYSNYSDTVLLHKESLLDKAENWTKANGVPASYRGWKELAAALYIPHEAEILRRSLANGGITKDNLSVHQLYFGPGMDTEEVLDKAEGWTYQAGVPVNLDGWEDIVNDLVLPCKAETLQRGLAKRGITKYTASLIYESGHTISLESGSNYGMNKLRPKYPVKA